MSRYFKEKEQKPINLTKYISDKDLSLQPDRVSMTYKKLGYLIGGSKQLEPECFDVVWNYAFYVEKPYQFFDKDASIISFYKLCEKFSYLTEDALRLLSLYYSKELFERENLENILEDLVDTFGKTDKTFTRYLEYVEQKEQKLISFYETEYSKLDELKDRYSDKFITFLKQLITKEHKSFDELSKYLPSPEIIAQDEEHSSKICALSVALRGPISYKMYYEMVKGDIHLDKFPEQPEYFISRTEGSIEASFTKTEYLESLEKFKVLKK